MARRSSFARATALLLTFTLGSQGIAHAFPRPAAAQPAEAASSAASEPVLGALDKPIERQTHTLDAGSCLFDDFERSVTGGWGNATPGPGTWVLLQGNTDSFNAYHVTDGRGYIDSTPGNTGPTDGDPALRVIRSFADPITISLEFEVNALEGNPFHEPQFYLRSSAGGGFYGLDVWIDETSPAESYVAAYNQGASEPHPSGLPDFAERELHIDTQYAAKIEFDGEATRVKVWEASAPEPDWQLANGDPTDPFNAPTEFYFYVPNAGTGLRVDNLNFDTGDCTPTQVPDQAVPVAMQAQQHKAFSFDPVGTYSGDFQYSFTDVAIAGRGPSPQFVRAYNSLDTRVGALGLGWTHNYETRLRGPGDASGDLFFVAPNGASDRYTHNPDDTFTAPPAVFRTLVHNPDGTYTATELDLSSWKFDASGNLTAITDRFGNTSTLVYNAQDELISVSDPAGRGSLTLSYTGGLLTSVTDWAAPARTVTYQYDTNGRLWKITDRENQTTTFGYESASSRLTTITDARGNVAVTMTYDPQGRVLTQKDAQGLATGATTTFAYVVNGDGTRETTVAYPATSFEPAHSPSVTDSYNTQGWLTQRVSRPTSTEILTETFAYDTTGNQTSVTDARGFATDLCYDVSYTGNAIPGSRGNLTRRIDPAPAAGANRPVTLFSYDGKNNPTQTVAPKGVPSGTSVTCATDLSAINTAYATDMVYDASGALLLSSTSRFIDPDLGLQTAVTKFEYNDSANPGQLTRLIPPRGNTTGTPDYAFASTMTYASSGSHAGMLISSADPLGNTATYAYDSVGRATSSVDPLGNAAGGVPADHTSTASYDNEDRVRFTAAPAPFVGGSSLITEFRYDEVGNRIVQIDANGQVTAYSYDNRDGLFQVKESHLAWADPASPPASVITTEYAYDAMGNLARMTRAKGDAAAERVTDYAYDGRNLVRRETQYPAWPSTSPTLVTSSTYDANGNPLTLLDPLAQTTTSSYDRLNRLTGIDYSSPGTPDVTYAYDAHGNRTSMLDGTGSTSYAYDEADRVTLVTSPGPKTVGYRYDLDGNRRKLNYPDGAAVDYTFNQASQLAALTDWASRQVVYTYFPDGSLKDATNPNGTVASYGYDNARRLTDVDHTLGSNPILDLGYAIDNVGNVTEIAEAGSPVSTYAYDRLHRLTSATEPIVGATTYAYDPVGNRSSRDRSGTTVYTYDRADRITSLQAPPAPGSSSRPPASNDAGWTSSVNGYSSNNTYATTAPNKNKTKTVSYGTFGFDSTIPANATITAVTLSVEWKVSTTASIATLGARAYVNGSGVGTELVNIAEPTTDTTQTFTVPGLTRAQLLNGAFTVRVRATRGNSNTAFTASLDTVSVTVDYTVPGNVTLTSNANGNLVANGADTFTYDQANRLISATVAGTTETYGYDGDGVRFSRQIGTGPVIRYVSDINTSLPVTLEDGTRKYVWGLGLAYAVSGSTIEVFHTDRLGSVRTITDIAGAVTSTYRTDEYGVATSSTGGGGQPFTFTGEPRDATGLSFLRARYYDPSLGRFLSRDPWAGRSCSPITLNRYAYVGANPQSSKDPSGLKAQALVGIQAVGPLPGPPPMDPHCSDLSSKIASFVRDVATKYWDLRNDKWDLKWGRNPGKGTVGGHQSRYRGLLTGYDRMVQRWRDDGCPGDPPALPSEYRDVPSPDPGPVLTPGIDPAPFAVGAGAAAVLYAVYRVARFIPSLWPPLWWTAAYNAAIP